MVELRALLQIITIAGAFSSVFNVERSDTFKRTSEIRINDNPIMMASRMKCAKLCLLYQRCAVFSYNRGQWDCSLHRGINFTEADDPNWDVWWREKKKGMHKD